MKRKLLTSGVLVILILASGILLAQTPAVTTNPGAATSTPSDDKAINGYRLNFQLHEIEDGKTINTRQYALNVVPGYDPSNELKIGTRVPVEAKQGEMQYIDVGTSIWARMIKHADALELEVHADLSNFASPDEKSQTTTSMPLLRQLRINASTIAALSKPMVVGIVDDPNSKRQYQLEVTVTQLH